MKISGVIILKKISSEPVINGFCKIKGISGNHYGKIQKIEDNVATGLLVRNGEHSQFQSDLSLIMMMKLFMKHNDKHYEVAYDSYRYVNPGETHAGEISTFKCRCSQDEEVRVYVNDEYELFKIVDINFDTFTLSSKLGELVYAKRTDFFLHNRPDTRDLVNIFCPMCNRNKSCKHEKD